MLFRSLMTRAPASDAGTPVGGAGHATVALFDAVAPRLVGFGEPSRFSF